MTENKVFYLPPVSLGDRGGPPLLKGGDGGGTFDGMEARVARLEGQIEKIGDKVSDLVVETAVLKERVNHLPSKGFIVSALLAGFAVIGGLIVFQERIVALLG